MTALRIGLADLHDIETRVKDPATGGEKGVKLTQVGALDPVALLLVSRVAGFGAAKYEAFNYLKGYDWAHSFNAMQRHAMLFWAGENADAESGLPHMAHAAWHALALISFAARGVGTDTRPTPPTDPESYLAEVANAWLDALAVEREDPDSPGTPDDEDLGHS